MKVFNWTLYSSIGSCLGTFESRKRNIIRVIDSESPEIITLQKCSKRAFEQLQEHYRFRYEAAFYENEDIGIFWATKKFRKIHEERIPYNGSYHDFKVISGGLLVELEDRKTKEVFRVCTADIEKQSQKPRGLNQLISLLTHIDRIEREADHTIIAANFNVQAKFDHPREQKGVSQASFREHRYYKEMHRREYRVMSFKTDPLEAFVPSHFFYKSLNRQTSVAVASTQCLSKKKNVQKLSNEKPLCTTFYPVNSRPLGSFSREVLICLFRGDFPIVLSNKSVDLRLWKLITEAMEKSENEDAEQFRVDMCRVLMNKIRFTKYWFFQGRILDAINLAFVKAAQHYSQSVRMPQVLYVQSENPSIFMQKRVYIVAAIALAFLASSCGYRLGMQQACPSI